MTETLMMPIDAMELIRPFCAKEAGSKYQMTSPFVRGGWRYATDGRICVRIPGEGSLDTKVEVPPAQNLFAVRPDISAFVHDWPTLCRQCGGAGEVRMVFSGDVVICAACAGLKAFTEREFRNGGTKHFVTLGEHWIDAEYVRRIGRLPNVKYAVIDNSAFALPFIFDGGQGVVMGLRK